MIEPRYYEDGEPKPPGYYWWLPFCEFDKSDDPNNWSVISFHELNNTRQKSGTFYGPIQPPTFERKGENSAPSS